MKTNFTAEELEQFKKFIAPANIEQFEKMIESKSEFTKDDLRTGDKVITRSGRIWLVVKDCNTRIYGRQSFIIIDLMNDSSFMISDEYNVELICRSGNELYKEFDIMEVYRDMDECMSGYSIKNNIDSYDLIWSRE